MYVKEEMRGSGIGLELLIAVKNCAKNNYVKHLYLGCNAENLAIYRKAEITDLDAMIDLILEGDIAEIRDNKSLLENYINAFY